MKRILFILIAIFLLFSFLRFNNLDHRIIFDWDQEQYSYQIKNIIENKDFSLLGPRVNNDKGFFLGPYFIYLLVPFYMFRLLNPAALIDFIIAYNIIFFVASFLIISKLFSHKHALVFLTLWSINSGMVSYEIIPWNPILIPLGIIFTWLVLKKVYDKPITKNFILLGLLLGFFINIHFQFVFIILFAFLMLGIKYKNNLIKNIKKFIYLALSFLSMFIPLFIFDLRNNFLNTKLFIGFFTEDNPALVNDRNIWVVVFSNFLKPFIYKQNLEYMWLFMFVIAGVVIYLIKNKKDFTRNFYISFLTIFIATPIAFYLYATRPSEYYFLFLIPFILIALVDFFLTLKREYLIILLVLFLVTINNKAMKINLKPTPIGLYYKNKTISTLKKKVDLSKKFNVTIDAPLGFHNGYKYLLDWYEIPQSGDFKDPLIQIKLPPEGVDYRINDGIGIIIPKELRKRL